MSKYLYLIATTALFFQCCSMAQAADQQSLPGGIWGGKHLKLTLTKDGGTLEYDCAQGTISVAVHRCNCVCSAVSCARAATATNQS
jgi:hypothetical protein